MSSVKKSTKSAKAKAGRSKSAARSSRASDSSTRKARTTAARSKAGKGATKISRTKQTDRAKAKSRATKSARTLPSKAKAKARAVSRATAKSAARKAQAKTTAKKATAAKAKQASLAKQAKAIAAAKPTTKSTTAPALTPRQARPANSEEARALARKAAAVLAAHPSSRIGAQRAGAQATGKAQTPLAAKAPEAAKAAEAAQPQTRIPDGRPAGGLISKNIKPGTPKAGFKTLEFIVYPAHGVGQIIAIEEQEVAGFKLELFVISFAKDKMILKVPTPKSVSVGMRKLAGPEVVKRALDTLTGRARIKRTMWSRRAQEYEAKINSGDLVSIAEVVRDLYRSDAQPEQSYSERQLYEAALDRVAREIAVVQKLTETESLKLIESQLQKGPRRGKPEEGEAEVEGDGEAAPEGDVDEAAAA